MSKFTIPSFKINIIIIKIKMFLSCISMLIHIFHHCSKPNSTRALIRSVHESFGLVLWTKSTDLMKHSVSEECIIHKVDVMLTCLVSLFTWLVVSPGKSVFKISHFTFVTHGFTFLFAYLWDQKHWLNDYKSPQELIRFH